MDEQVSESKYDVEDEESNMENAEDEVCCKGDNLKPLVIGRRFNGHDVINRVEDEYFQCEVCGDVVDINLLM